MYFYGQVNPVTSCFQIIFVSAVRCIEYYLQSIY